MTYNYTRDPLREEEGEVQRRDVPILEAGESVRSLSRKVAKEFETIEPYSKIVIECQAVMAVAFYNEAIAKDCEIIFKYTFPSGEGFMDLY